MTFKINDVDFSDVIQRYGYATTYDPVYTNSMMSMNGIEHVGYLRHRGSVTITLNPLEGTRLSQLAAALAGGIYEIKYTCLQRNTDIITRMRLTGGMSSEILLKNASRVLSGNTQLTFQEL